jgi:DNA-binding CsgD family transcriptional regulator
MAITLELESVRSAVAAEDQADGGVSAEVRRALATLTAAEFRVLWYVAQELSSREIALALNRSVRTIENQRTIIAQKLDLRGPNGTLYFARDHRELLAAMGAGKSAGARPAIHPGGPRLHSEI